MRCIVEGSLGRRVLRHTLVFRFNYRFGINHVSRGRYQSLRASAGARHSCDPVLDRQPGAWALPRCRLALAPRLKGGLHRIFCLTSDGEWQEGSTPEALIFACHHKLAKLTILVDHNRLQGFGTTAEVASMDPLSAKLSGSDLDSCATRWPDGSSSCCSRCSAP